MQIPLSKAAAWFWALPGLRVTPYTSSNHEIAVLPQEYPPVVINYLNGSLGIRDAPSTNRASALYTMTNDPAGNWLLAIPLNEDGSIQPASQIVRYSLQGKGARFNFTGSTIQDALDSQGSVIQSGSRVFAVNAGSNTFRAFAVNCKNATDLIPLEGPVSVNGQNPSTIAVNNADQIACIATTGNATGIACYDYSVGFGKPEIRQPQFFTGTNKTFELRAPQTGLVPTGPPNTVSQLLFTYDFKYLVVIVKGALNPASQTVGLGYIDMYPLSAEGLGTPIRSVPYANQLLFGCVFKYNSYDLFCSDAQFGAVLLKQMGSNGYQPASATSKLDFGNGSNCWTASSPFPNGPYYMTAVDKNYIASFDKATGKFLAQTNFTNGNPNLIEMAVAKDYVYALSFGNATYPPHITVARDVGLAGNLREVQNFLIPNAGDCISGLAAFIQDDNANTCDFT